MLLQPAIPIATGGEWGQGDCHCPYHHTAVMCQARSLTLMFNRVSATELPRRSAVSVLPSAATGSGEVSCRGHLFLTLTTKWHMGWAVLPLSHPQGQLTPAPHNRVSSTMLPGQDAWPVLASVAVGEGQGLFS